MSNWQQQPLSQIYDAGEPSEGGRSINTIFYVLETRQSDALDQRLACFIERIRILDSLEARRFIRESVIRKEKVLFLNSPLFFWRSILYTSNTNIETVTVIPN
jgi:hypothetical protein